MRSTILVTMVAVVCSTAAEAQTTGAAARGFERLKALEGEWIDVDGVFGTKGAVAVTYKVTGGGHTLVETFPVGTPQEMVTVYHLDGNEVALTHYCTSNTQPRMRSKGVDGNRLAFEFAGGANIDPAKNSYMHAVRIEFVSADEIKATWSNWAKGKSDHEATFRVVRKK